MLRSCADAPARIASDNTQYFFITVGSLARSEFRTIADLHPPRRGSILSSADDSRPQAWKVFDVELHQVQKRCAPATKRTVGLAASVLDCAAAEIADCALSPWYSNVCITTSGKIPHKCGASFRRRRGRTRKGPPLMWRSARFGWRQDVRYARTGRYSRSIISFTSHRPAAWFFSKRAADMICPDVQYRTDTVARQKRLLHRVQPARLARPSIVVMSSPSCMIASVKHELIRRPLHAAVHARTARGRNLF